MTLSSLSMLVPMLTKSLFSLDVLPLCQAFFPPFFSFRISERCWTAHRNMPLV